jgi:hypothetical protein
MIISFYYKAEQPLLESDITAFETSIGKTLPTDYKDHMRAWNGGGIRQFTLEHKDYPENPDYGLESLLPIAHHPNTISVVMNALGSALPSEHIPIGSTLGGGDLVMSLKNDSTYGEIYVGFSGMDLFRVATSFTALLAAMVEI